MANDHAWVHHGSLGFLAAITTSVLPDGFPYVEKMAGSVGIGLVATCSTSLLKRVLDKRFPQGK